MRRNRVSELGGPRMTLESASAKLQPKAARKFEDLCLGNRKKGQEKRNHTRPSK